ncbi:anti-sigma B factor RsbW [Mechercharimyces sp. CAU 1602]|uniref:anti-sigma B factor RsbW n=1 Tax=Mechercharimyces sp. CAU 1602 TaxID=2973933 RepID=UPI0021629059|nr:anti-sigma B factor RsbW [Mechercharimyces sp. CAU 1602]MCS1352136.1 anti-sigma B factor RsbW [Mechercharimyces sp. CAU 1602]
MKVEAVDEITINIPAKPDFVGIVRLSLSGIANRMGFSYDDIEDMKLAIAEACTNAVEHAYQGTATGEVAVTYSLFADRLEVKVEDKGCSFDSARVQSSCGPIQNDQPLPLMRERGLGIYLMKTLMDNVEISDGEGVVVVMTKYLRRDEVEPHVAISETKSY